MTADQQLTARSDIEKPKFFLPYYVELKAKNK